MISSERWIQPKAAGPLTKPVLLLVCLLLSSLSWSSLYSKGLDVDHFTSDFMIGDVAIAVIFPESDGSLDENREDWSDSRKTRVLNEIMTGLDWWTQQNPRSPLSFTYVTQTVPTRYEPITRPYYDESLWIPDVLSRLGYKGSRFSACRDYINDLRKKQRTDWGYIIFVVDSLNDPNGKLADSFFAYAYLGGPYVVLTYDNGGYGIDNMDVVIAHETGHIFHALDEYAGGSSPFAYSHGYFPTINGNHVLAPTASDPSSIMRGGIRWGLSRYAKLMIGWRDLNQNGRDDIVDQDPSVTMSSKRLTNTPGVSGFAGTAEVNVLPRQENANGYGLSLDRIAQVQYRVEGGDWTNAQPSDGLFDSGAESFLVEVAAPSEGNFKILNLGDIEIKAVTAFSLLKGSGGTPPPVKTPVASSLANAHAFPNPFKPNSGLAHLAITFTALTPGAHIHIFSSAGEPVYDKKLSASQSTITWKAVDESGSAVASGLYYYLINDDAGNTKKGKLAIIR